MHSNALITTSSWPKSRAPTWLGSRASERPARHPGALQASGRHRLAMLWGRWQARERVRLQARLQVRVRARVSVRRGFPWRTVWRSAVPLRWALSTERASTCPMPCRAGYTAGAPPQCGCAWPVLCCWRALWASCCGDCGAAGPSAAWWWLGTRTPCSRPARQPTRGCNCVCPPLGRAGSICLCLKFRWKIHHPARPCRARCARAAHGGRHL